MTVDVLVILQRFQGLSRRAQPLSEGRPMRIDAVNRAILVGELHATQPIHDYEKKSKRNIVLSNLPEIYSGEH